MEFRLKGLLLEIAPELEGLHFLSKDHRMCFNSPAQFGSVAH